MTTRRPPIPAHTDTRLDQLLDGAILVGLTVLILVGFTTSYRTLRDLAATVGGYPEWLAPAVPLSFDLGIVVLSLKVARAAREGRTAPFLRLLVGALSATTVVANASAAATWAAAILHAVPPALFVICFETVIVSARRRALTERGLMPEPLPRLRTARWLLAPRSTWSCWRKQILTDNSPGTSTPLDEITFQVTRRTPSQATAAYTKPHPALDRLQLVRQLLRANPDASTRQITSALAEHGHRVSIRTVQRIRSQAAYTERPSPDSVSLHAVRR